MITPQSTIAGELRDYEKKKNAGELGFTAAQMNEARQQASTAAQQQVYAPIAEYLRQSRTAGPQGLAMGAKVTAAAIDAGAQAAGAAAGKLNVDSAVLAEQRRQQAMAAALEKRKMNMQRNAQLTGLFADYLSNVGRAVTELVPTILPG